MSWIDPNMLQDLADAGLWGEYTDYQNGDLTSEDIQATLDNYRASNVTAGSVPAASVAATTTTTPTASTTNPYSQYITETYEAGVDEQGFGYSGTRQVINPQWQAWQTANSPTQPVAPAYAGPDLSSRYDNPWAIDATAFHSAVDPMLQNNFWSSPEGQNGSIALNLLGGKTWTPSGANSYIKYHPAGEMIGAWSPGPDDNPNSGSPGVANPYAYYDVSGDMSALLGQDGSNVHANVKYVEQNGKLIPVADPATWQWTNTGSFSSLLNGLGPIPGIALAIATGGMSLAEQIAASAALQLAKGADLGSILQSAVSSYIGSGITGSDAVQQVAGQLSSIDPALGSAFNSAVVGGTRAALSGGDVLQSALTAGATGGINAAVQELSANIPGFSDLSSQNQQLVSNAITAALAGKPLDQIALNAALAAGTQALNQTAYTTGDPNYIPDDATFPADYTGTPADYSTPIDYTPPADYVPTTDFTSVPVDYSLPTGVEDSGNGLAMPEITPDYTADYSTPIDYSIAPEPTNLDYLGGGQGLVLPDYTTLPDMGGGQGLTVDTGTGYLNEAGYVPYEHDVVLGDPASFINDPAVTGLPVLPTPSAPTSTTPTASGGVSTSVVPTAPVSQTPAVVSAPSSATPAYTAKPLETYAKGLYTGEAGKYLSLYDPRILADKGIMSKFNQDPSLMQEVADRLQTEQTMPQTPTTSYYSYGVDPSSVIPNFNTAGVETAIPKSPLAFMRGGLATTSVPALFAAGGVPHKGSHYVQGEGGGQDDLIDARLADGEYVFDADVVAALGDGSNKEGARKLDAMREAIRKHKRSAPVDGIPPKAKSPLAYLKGFK